MKAKEFVTLVIVTGTWVVILALLLVMVKENRQQCSSKSDNRTYEHEEHQLKAEKRVEPEETSEDERFVPRVRYDSDIA